MNENLPADLSDIFGADDVTNDLSDGVTGGFAVISIRGSKWRIKRAGEEEPILNADGDPIPSMEVVLVKSAPSISRTYYKDQYVEGSDAEPDCTSIDGIAPDAGCANPQAKTCAACPQSRWGSRITDNGKKAQACSQTRRVAIVPAGDIPNEVYGGPMMLRVPPASLNDLAVYGKRLGQKGIDYRKIVTRLGFDVNTAFPKLTFKAVRKLEEDELREVAAHIVEGTVLERILEMPLEESTDEVEQEEVAAVDVDFEEPEQEPAPKPAAKKAVKKKAVKKAAKKTEPEPEPEPSADALDNELDDILGDLDNLM
jgi:hypothetical protein